MSKELSWPKEKINILLLEGIHPQADTVFEANGYKVRRLPGALSESELLAEIPGVHILGIRSKTKVSEKVIEEGRSLLAIGCFCIGTNQVALKAGARKGVPVFNAPFSNTRSVAELTMAEIVMLARRAAHQSASLHRGEWNKSATGCHEVKGKTLGIVGYGHIGPQVGLLAEAFGMRVFFYDIEKKLPMGSAAQLNSLEELFRHSDFVTMHVPLTDETVNMISARELSFIKKGGFFLNLSRGEVVDLDALRQALVSGALSGAAVDVYPEEPSSSKASFTCALQNLDNVILTPHVGGSTEEAQEEIGKEVSTSLVQFLDTGSSMQSVNVPEVRLPLLRDTHRVLNFHKNVPGALSEINKILAQMDVNIHAQQLGTKGEIGYLVMDVAQNVSRSVKQSLDILPVNIKTRLLF